MLKLEYIHIFVDTFSPLKWAVLGETAIIAAGRFTCFLMSHCQVLAACSVSSSLRTFSLIAVVASGSCFRCPIASSAPPLSLPPHPFLPPIVVVPQRNRRHCPFPLPWPQPMKANSVASRTAAGVSRPVHVAHGRVVQHT